MSINLSNNSAFHLIKPIQIDFKENEYTEENEISVTDNSFDIELNNLIFNTENCNLNLLKDKVKITFTWKILKNAFYKIMKENINDEINSRQYQITNYMDIDTEDEYLLNLRNAKNTYVDLDRVLLIRQLIDDYFEYEKSIWEIDFITLKKYAEMISINDISHFDNKDNQMLITLILIELNLSYLNITHATYHKEISIVQESKAEQKQLINQLKNRLKYIKSVCLKTDLVSLLDLMMDSPLYILRNLIEELKIPIFDDIKKYTVGMFISKIMECLPKAL
jgi:hypothetical protein